MDVPSESNEPSRSSARRKRIDLYRSLASRRLIEKPVKASSRLFEEVRKFRSPDEAKEAVRRNKREAPFKFFDAYESLRQVYDEFYSINSEYEGFHKFERLLDNLSIKVLKKYKNQGENIIEKIDKILDLGDNGSKINNHVREMENTLSWMETAEKELGLSYLSKKNKKTMKRYIQSANGFRSFIETIDLETLKKNLHSDLAKIESVEEILGATREIIREIGPKNEKIDEYLTHNMKSDWMKQRMIGGFKLEKLKKLNGDLIIKSLFIKHLIDETKGDLEAGATTPKKVVEASEKLGDFNTQLPEQLKLIEEQLEIGYLSYISKIKVQKSKIREFLSTNEKLIQALREKNETLIGSVEALAKEPDELLDTARRDVKGRGKEKNVYESNSLERLQQLTGSFDSLASKSKELGEKYKALCEQKALHDRKELSSIEDFIDKGAKQGMFRGNTEYLPFLKQKCRDIYSSSTSPYRVNVHRDGENVVGLIYYWRGAAMGSERILLYGVFVLPQHPNAGGVRSNLANNLIQYAQKNSIPISCDLRATRKDDFKLYTKLGGKVIQETLCLSTDKVSDVPLTEQGQTPPTIELATTNDDETDCTQMYKALSDYNATFEQHSLEVDFDAAKKAFKERQGSPAQWYVARIEGQPVGLLILRESNHIEMIYVEEELRGKRIGQHLINKAKQICRDAGKSELYVSMVSKNEKAKQFYNRVGFKPFMYNIRWSFPPAQQDS